MSTIDTAARTTPEVRTTEARTAEAVIDEATLQTLLGRMAGEVAGAWGMASINLGVRHGLYQALLDGGPTTSDDLARRTDCNDRLVREWLTGQVVSGYLAVGLDGHYYLTPEQAAVLADRNAPTYMGGMAEVLSATARGQGQIDAAFRGSGALAWGDQHPGLFDGFDHSFAPTYRAALADAWIPALDGVAERLAAGGRVADIGTGHGTAVMVMAEAYPASTFAAVDVHAASLDVTAKKASEAGVSHRVRTHQASGTDFSGGPFDLITFFDSLHDMGDPDRVIAHARRQLADTGTVMLVEPMVSSGPDDEAGALVARMFYPSSVMLCTPSALVSGSTALGNQVPDDTWRDLFLANGFSSFRRATETPFNRVFEARP